MKHNIDNQSGYNNEPAIELMTQKSYQKSDNLKKLKR